VKIEPVISQQRQRDAAAEDAHQPTSDAYGMRQRCLLSMKDWPPRIIFALALNSIDAFRGVIGWDNSAVV
jgi:hypothetical protein